MEGVQKSTFPVINGVSNGGGLVLRTEPLLGASLFSGVMIS